MKAKLLAAGEGINIYLKYSDMPKNSDESILFVHGYPDSHSSWEKQLDFFKTEFQVGAFDLRGAGKSTAPFDRSGYRISELVNDLKSVIDDMVGKDGKIHLVGHDWGSIICWSFLSSPENEKRVLSYSAVTCPHPMMFYKNIFGKLFSFDPNRVAEGLNQILKSYYMLFFQIPMIPEFLWKNFTIPLWEMLMKTAGIPENDPMRRLSADEILSFTLNTVNLYREALQTGVPSLPRIPIQIPVAMFIPEDDLALSPELYDETETYVRNLRYFRIQANHWVHREKPDWFNQTLYSFIRGASPAKQKKK